MLRLSNNMVMAFTLESQSVHFFFLSPATDTPELLKSKPSIIQDRLATTHKYCTMLIEYSQAQGRVNRKTI